MREVSPVVTNLPKPCPGARRLDGEWEGCGKLGPKSRCDKHAAMADARRGTPSARGYDARHRRDSKLTIFRPDGSRRPCELRLKGCTYWADTADHVVARVDGRRVSEEEGGRLLIPACRHCNSSRKDHPLAVAVEPEEEPWTPDP